jgi:hypothetical protein
MTGEGNPLKRLVPKIGREGMREICEDRVVGGSPWLQLFILMMLMMINIIIDLLPTISIIP